MAVDYEKSMLVVAEALRVDLEQAGVDQSVIQYVNADITGRKTRIAQLENPEISGNSIFFPYTDGEKQTLKNDGAVVYLLEGQSIGSQKRGGRRFWSDWHEGHPIESIISRIYEVAIWPKDFFVPETFNEPKLRQEELVRAHGEKTGSRLGIPNYTEILPEAPEATEVLFKHFDLTEVRLLGKDYKTKEGYWSYIITSTPTNESGSGVAVVGRFDAVNGPYVRHWYALGSIPNFGAARWGVKIISR